MSVARKLSLTTSGPPAPKSLGLFNLYDGNIIGGSLMGAGMALSGACPGTVIAQAAMGARTGYFVFLGGVIGGGLYSRFGHTVVYDLQKPNDHSVLQDVGSSSAQKGHESTGSSNRPQVESITLQTKISASSPYAILMYETICLGLVSLAWHLDKVESKSLVHPILGGLLIGLVQIPSLLIAKRPLGTSKAYEELGDTSLYLHRLLFPSHDRWQSLPDLTSTPFMLGSFLGCLVLRLLLTIPDVPEPQTLKIHPLRAVLGGVVVIYGARLAGGCTSGHGISGMSQLSVASFVSVVVMFAAGVGVTALLKVV